MPKLVLALAVIALYLLHQDFWFWRDARLVFGVVPIGLFYHAMYCFACAGMMWALVKHSWPADLEEAGTDQQPATPLRGQANNQQPS